MESQSTNILASKNVKHNQVEAVLQGQAVSRSGHGGSGENKVTIRPLRLQEDYSPEKRKFGGFFLPLPPLEIHKHLRVLEGPLGPPSPPEPWQAHYFLPPISHSLQLGVPSVS